MPSRFKSAAVSLVAVTACYWLYALLVAPFIEPTVNAQTGRQSTEEERAQAAMFPEKLRILLAEHFPEGHWVHDNAMVFQSLRGLLLIHNYEPQADGKLEIKPCAMVLFPEPFDGEGPSPKRTIILEAPQGALLTFDEGFDLASGKFGQFSRGYLRGEITIRSDWDQPGPEDDLLIVTQEVHMTERRIWTQYAVNFRLGRSQGGGRDLSIRLAPAPLSKARSEGTPNIGGIESFELGHDVEVHLDVGDKRLFSSSENQPAITGADESNAQAGRIQLKSSKPVQISCRGAFRFNLVEREATFDDHVDVFQSHPNAPSDHLSCQELTIEFAEKAAPEASPAGSSRDPRYEDEPRGVSALEPVIVRATGNPVVVESSVNQGRAEGDILEYDVREGKITLKLRGNLESQSNRVSGAGAQRYVYLLQRSNKAYAQELVYWPAKIRGGLGAMEATGPGLISIIPDESEPDNPLLVRWNKRFSLRREQGEQMLSVTGRPNISLPGMGSLVVGGATTPGEIRLWLVEPGDARYQELAGQAMGYREPLLARNPLADRSEVARKTALPTRMQATGGVQILDSERIEGQVDELRIWFQHIAARPENGQSNQTTRRSLFEKPTGTEKEGQKKYAIDGQRLDVQTVFSHRDGKIAETQIAGLSLESATNAQGQIVRSAQFRELASDATSETPFSVVGSRIELKQADTRHAQVSAMGVANQRARIVARGMTFDCLSMTLDQGTNRLWCDQPGRIAMLVSKDLRGRESKTPQLLTVDWQKSLNFDGRTARFVGDVVARGTDQELKTAQMDLRLTDRIDFNERAQFKKQNRRKQVELQEFACSGGVSLVSRAPDEMGRPTFDRLFVGSLKVNQQTGAIEATPPESGPGWFKSTRFGGGFDSSSAPGATPARDKPQDKLQYLFVRFHRSAKGRIELKELTLFGDVRTVYGPVEHWDREIEADSVSRLKPNEMSLDCDQLKIAQMPTGLAGKQSIELKAVGNVESEFDEFTAFANEMTYSQAKEKISLKGVPSIPAVIHYKSKTGNRRGRHPAQEFTYWRKSGKLQVNGGGEIRAIETGAR